MFRRFLEYMNPYIESIGALQNSRFWLVRVYRGLPKRYFLLSFEEQQRIPQGSKYVKGRARGSRRRAHIQTPS